MALTCGRRAPATRSSAIEGLDRVSEETRSRVVEVSLPLARAAPTGTYDGDGYIVVRDPETEAVEAALTEIISTVRVAVA